jgi:hypothetical protein
MSAFFFSFAVLRRLGLSMGRSPFQGVLPKCLEGFIVSEVTSDLDEAKGPNP